MQNSREDKFKEIMVRVIERETDDFKERYEMLKDFYQNEEYYYDLLCDLVYLFSVDYGSGCVYIDVSGMSHSCRKDDIPHQLLLLSREDLKPGCSDIVFYIDIALKRLKEAVLDTQDKE